MPESWFELSSADQSEALEVAAGRSGRPAHLLEKDIWVVWALSAIYDSPLGDSLTFKGGTSLSKVYKVIDRFSEDIDLTYDIRELVSDLLRDGNPIPASASQEKKITSAVRSRLPRWIEQTVQPVIEHALVASGLQAELSLAGKDSDKLIILIRRPRREQVTPQPRSSWSLVREPPVNPISDITWPATSPRSLTG